MVFNFLLWMVVLMHIFWQHEMFSYADTDLKTSFACYGQILTIQCQEHQTTIHVVSAEYGKPSSKCKAEIPDDSQQYVFCTFNVTNKFSNLCNGLHKCTAPINDTTMPSKCSLENKSKYFSIEYKCIKQIQIGDVPPVTEKCSLHEMELKSTKSNKILYYRISSGIPQPVFNFSGSLIVPTHTIVSSKKYGFTENISLSYIEDSLGLLNAEEATEQTTINTGMMTEPDRCIAPTMNSSFCMHNQTGQLKNNGELNTGSWNKSYIRRDELVLRIQEYRNCFVDQNVTVLTVSDCFPMDYLYEKVQVHCPNSIKKRFTLPLESQTWPDDEYRVYVDGGIVLGQLDVNTGLTSLFEDGIYTLYIKIYKNKTYKIPFKYISSVPNNNKSNNISNSNTNNNTNKNINNNKSNTNNNNNKSNTTNNNNKSNTNNNNNNKSNTTNNNNKSNTNTNNNNNKTNNTNNKTTIYNIESRVDNETDFIPTVSGKGFTIPFHKEMFFEKNGALSILIISNLNNRSIIFNKTDALNLLGTSRLNRSPNDKCLHYFKLWRSGYELLLRKNGNSRECAQDYEMFYTYISYCQSELWVKRSNQWKFQHFQTLSCSGVRIDFEDQIQWYKDFKLMEGATGKTLNISGHQLVQEGYYHCELSNGISKQKKSRPVYIQFQGSVHTKVILNMSVDFNIVEGKNMSNNIPLTELKSKITSAILATNITQHRNCSMPVIRCSYISTHKEHWLIETVCKAMLTPPFKVNEYYNKLKINATGGRLIHQLSLKVLDRDHCLPDTTVDGNGTNYSWNLTPVNARQKFPCRHGKVDVLRSCFRFNFSTFAKWKDPTQIKCDKGAQNKVNAKLDDILKNILSSTAMGVTTELIGLTSSLNRTLTVQQTVMIKTILQRVAESAQRIELQTAQNMLKVIDNIMEMNEEVLKNAQKEGKTLEGIIGFLETVALKLSPQEGDENQDLLQVSTKSVGLARFQQQQSKNRFTGRAVSINTRASKLFDIGTKKRNSDSGIVITLPNSIFDDANTLTRASNVPRTLQFVHYETSALFTPVSNVNKTPNRQNPSNASTESNFDNAPNLQILNGVFSVSVGKVKSVDLSENLEFTMTTSFEVNERNIQCSYWDFSKNDGFGGWSRDGCKTIGAAEGKITCSCNHLTNFAVLFNPDVKSFRSTDAQHRLALSIISYIGCGLSLAGIFVTLLSLLCFRSLRRNVPSKVLIALCSSLAVLLLLFMILIDRKDPPWLCLTTSALIQFFILNCFCCMLVEAMTLYLKVVKVMGGYPSKFILKSIIWSFGVPAVLVTLGLSLSIGDYQNNDYCIVSGSSLWYGLLAPVGFILAVNATIFVMVIYSLHTTAGKSKNKSTNHESSNDVSVQVRIAISCCTLLGLTWIFGLFANVSLVFQYLFCIFNSLQGVFIFYFNILRQPHITAAWRNYWSDTRAKYELNTFSTSKAKSTSSTNKIEEYSLSADQSGWSSVLSATSQYANTPRMSIKMAEIPPLPVTSLPQSFLTCTDDADDTEEMGVAIIPIHQ